ncbi:hypothetical protein J437_LFUL013006 [Ladona fulva]|uniref:Uncharacterized protein n=1 Tax=Ladona fulva TaxID=123851 RepID=A0A8K0P3X2_LADFU|nr:hypothetical protein J437_LFUL013006 [Ladona fulva]
MLMILILFLWHSDGWADRSDVVEGLETEAVGSLSVRIHSPYVKRFDEFYFRLNPFTNDRNPWFREFWEERFNCTLPPTPPPTTPSRGRSKRDAASGEYDMNATTSEDESSFFSEELASPLVGNISFVNSSSAAQKTICTGLKNSLSSQLRTDR